MVESIPSESELYTPDADPLTADWFTAWERDREVADCHVVTCRQLITGSECELADLECRLVALLAEHSAASVRIRLVD